MTIPPKKFIVPVATHQEQQLLDEIFRRVGIQSKRLGGIDTRSRDVAELVLPVLADHLHHPGSIRGEIFLRFGTPYAAEFLDQLITVWLTEQDHINRSILDKVMEICLKNKTAPKVWNLLRTKAMFTTSEVHLLASLVRFPSVSQEVLKLLLDLLQTRDLTLGELTRLKRIKDVEFRTAVSEVESRRRAS